MKWEKTVGDDEKELEKLKKDEHKQMKVWKELVRGFFFSYYFWGELKSIGIVLTTGIQIFSKIYTEVKYL